MLHCDWILMLNWPQQPCQGEVVRQLEFDCRCLRSVGLLGWWLVGWLVSWFAVGWLLGCLVGLTILDHGKQTAPQHPSRAHPTSNCWGVGPVKSVWTIVKGNGKAMQMLQARGLMGREERASSLTAYIELSPRNTLQEALNLVIQTACKKWNDHRKIRKVEYKQVAGICWGGIFI